MQKYIHYNRHISIFTMLISKIITLLTLINLFLAFGCTTLQTREIYILGVGHNEALDVSLTVNKFSKDDELLLVSLTVKNKLNIDVGVYSLFIDFFSYYEDYDAVLLWNEWIYISNENNVEAPYYGVMASLYLDDITLDDCIVIKAGESYTIDFPNIYHCYGLKNFDYKELNIYYLGPLDPLGNSSVTTLTEFD